MNDFRIIEELCAICTLQNKIIVGMASALEQLGAEAMENERAEAELRYNALIGDGAEPWLGGERTEVGV